MTRWAGRRLSDREMYRRFTRLELKQADETACSVRAYLRGHTVDEVAERIGVPKDLVRRLAGEEIQYLADVIYWLRQRREGMGDGTLAT